MYDLAIIGGGPGGYVAAIRGAQKGLRTLLVEKDQLGGTCLNRGCIPTKCFVYDTKLFDAVRESPVIKGAEALTLDLKNMVERKRQVVNSLVGGLGHIMKSHGIEVVQAKGELKGQGQIRIHGLEGSSKDFKAKNIILATGSKPSVPPFIEVDGRLIQTTDEALDSQTIPKNLLIIGGGVIGLEMATIYHTLGSQVTILEMLPDIITTEDEDIRLAMRRLMAHKGVQTHLKAKVKEVNPKKKKVDVQFTDDAGKSHVMTVDRLLVATGRAPVLEGIDTNKLGIIMEGPFINVNSRLEINMPNVYAIGDLAGGMMLAHKASAEAEAVIDNILGGKKEMNPSHVPRCIWGFTEIGAVGLTEKEARDSGMPVNVGKFHFISSGAAQAMGDVNGFAKIIGHKETGEILGVHILGPHATDLIGEPVMAMTMESAVEDLAEAIHPHPTLSETIMEAAMDWSGLAIHMPKRRFSCQAGEVHL